jgi:aminopeptidase N
MDARFTLKGTQPSYSPDRTFDTEHIKLELALDFSRESLSGVCTTTLRAIVDADTMVFDAVNFSILKTTWNGASCKSVYKDGKLTLTSKAPVKAGQKVQVAISYRVTRPKLGLYFVKPTRHYPNKPTQVWTQGEDEYARHWFPCFDAPHDRTSTEMMVTVPEGYVAVSNGALKKTIRSRRARTVTYHWLQSIPHATYLVTLTVGRFSILKDTWRGKPVLYYCEKGREAETRRAFGKTPKMLEYFSKQIGVAYPYPKYAQIAVADFIYGGMENTSATTQTDTALLDARAAVDYSSDELTAHELAHQWFGDYLTCRHWAHAWLNESFATYFDALFKRFDKGEDEFLYQLRQNSDAYLSEDKDRYRRAIVTSNFKRPTDLFDRHLYEKGSVVLAMLHRELGDRLFWKSINAYVRKNAGRTVETTHLIHAIEEATGRNPRRFFDQWVYGSGHPEYKVRAWWDARRKELQIRTIQTNADSGLVFHAPVEFLVRTARGEQRFKETLTKKSHLFKFPVSSEPTLVLFDPDQILLKKVDFPKPEAWLLTQIEKDKNPLGRIDAAHALARIGSRAAVAALRKSLLGDTFWGVRAEAAQAVGSLRTEEAAQLLIHSLDVVDHPKVRRALYAGLRSYKNSVVANEVEKRFRKEASYFAEMEGLRLLGAHQHPRAADHLNAALKRTSWNEVIKQAALEGLAASKSPEAFKILFNHTKWGHPHRVRMAAMRSLVDWGPAEPAVQARLMELTRDPYILVQVAAVRALQQVGDERALPALKELLKGDRDGRVLRLAEEAIEKISKGIEN